MDLGTIKTHRVRSPRRPWLGVGLAALTLLLAGPELVGSAAPPPPLFKVCKGEVATIVLQPNVFTHGTTGRDVVVGSDGPDFYIGEGGGDLVCLLAGDDTATGGPGRERFYGGPGDDNLYGGAGRDRLFGGKDDDDLYGEGGIDVCAGGLGTDTTPFDPDGECEVKKSIP